MTGNRQRLRLTRKSRPTVVGIGLIAVVAAIAITFINLEPSLNGGALASAPGQETPNEIIVGGSHIKIQVNPGPLTLPRSAVIDWIRNSATSVSSYYGHFPVQKATIRVMPFYGHGFGFATTDSEDDHGVIVIPLGDTTNQSDLNRDWVLTHEMVHLGFPLVYPKHRWLVEGMATYIEPIARMQAGFLKPEKVWGDLVDDLPKGLPKDGDQGLNDNGSWGRTYWGGALFCFLADLEIRKATDNQKGLQQALKEIDSTGGDITSDLEVDDALKIGDKAIDKNAQILENLYKSMKDKPVKPDLKKIWQELGVKRVNDKIVFDDNAPLAKTRHAIETGI